MRLYLFALASATVSASSEARGPSAGYTPDLSQWLRCDAFTEAITATGTVSHFFLNSLKNAELPYTLAMMHLAKICDLDLAQFPEEIERYLAEMFLDNSRTSNEYLGTLMGLAEDDAVIDRIVDLIKSKEEKKYLKYILQAAVMLANQKLEGVLKGSFTAFSFSGFPTAAPEFRPGDDKELAEWSDCKTFMGGDKTAEKIIREFLTNSFMKDTLPYTMAMLKLAEKCEPVLVLPFRDMIRRNFFDRFQTYVENQSIFKENLNFFTGLLGLSKEDHVLFRILRNIKESNSEEFVRLILEKAEQLAKLRLQRLGIEIPPGEYTFPKSSHWETGAPLTFGKGHVPDIRVWQDCEAFSSVVPASGKTLRPEDRLAQVLWDSCEFAKLPYTFIMIHYGEECGYPLKERFSNELATALSRHFAMCTEDPQSARTSSAQYLGLSENDKFLDLIKTSIDAKNKGQYIRYMTDTARVIASRELKLLERERKETIGGSEGVEQPLQFEGASDVHEPEPTETRENKFVFPDTPSDPCSILKGEEPTAFLQSILASYGLGYALLFAHRLDTCSGDQQLVKNLHSDLYKWLSNQKLDGKEYAEIFRELGLVVDLKQLANLSAIGATLLVEKLSVEKITSKMEEAVDLHDLLDVDRIERE